MIILENVIIFLIILFIPCLSYVTISITYNKYREKNLKNKLSGFEVARKILDDNDLKDMYIVEVKGKLDDHYDYNQKVIRLSTDVFHGENVTAAVVAAKISGYAILDKNNNKFIRFFFLVNPFIVFLNYVAFLLFILGLFIQDFQVIELASLLLGCVLIFRLVELPLEFKVVKESEVFLNNIEGFEKNEILNMKSVVNVIPYTWIMSILTCISNLFGEIMYNLQKRG